ncbi:MAG TPA: hypothetical protein VNT79_16790, partial [Phycisphaerae bacterium]|nr:hypothetical protein [Phycisphaerae bacterium]
AEADKAAQEMSSTTAGEASASSHLGANRMKAILEYAKGRIERNRAAFSAWQALLMREQAEAIVDSVAKLGRNAHSLTARAPDEVIAGVTKHIEEEEQEIATLKGEVDAISTAVEEAEAKIKTLEEQAANARLRMTEMEAAGNPIHDENGEYAKLSLAARAAEVAADGMRFGTLADADIVPPPAGEDLLAMTYANGKQQLGVRDLRDRLELRQEQLAGREKTRDALVTRKDDLSRLRDEMRTRAGTASSVADEQRAVIDDLLSKAEAHHKAADQAAENAIKFFSQGAQAAAKASSAATTRLNDARALQAEATQPEAERLQMIVDDADMKASVDVIAAECAYNIALTRADQLDWVRTHHDLRADIASRTGRDAPEAVTEKIADLRQKAVAEAGKARKTYEDVAKSLAGSKAKVEGVAIQGKDYKWQAQVGQAAAQLLLGSLAETDEERRTAQNAAYDTLKEVIQGREQSPAIQPAIQAFLFLQQTAR